MHRRWLLLTLCLALLGCNRADPLASPTAAKLKGLGNVYLDYAVARGVGPADAAQLDKHMQGLPPFVLEGNHLSAQPGFASLTSERDGEPFVICYGVAITQISGDSAPVIAHEKHGQDGQCLVVYANGKVACVEASTLAAELAKR